MQARNPSDEQPWEACRRLCDNVDRAIRPEWHAERDKRFAKTKTGKPSAKIKEKMEARAREED